MQNLKWEKKIFICFWLFGELGIDEETAYNQKLWKSVFGAGQTPA